jgi:hypothetical protein
MDRELSVRPRAEDKAATGAKRISNPGRVSNAEW